MTAEVKPVSADFVLREESMREAMQTPEWRFLVLIQPDVMFTVSMVEPRYEGTRRVDVDLFEDVRLDSSLAQGRCYLSDLVPFVRNLCRHALAKLGAPVGPYIEEPPIFKL